MGMFRTLFSAKYQVKRAVDEVSFTINEGEIVGYIGANGAGKSTTIKMMCGILTPTSGKVLIDGVEPYKKRREVAKKIGVVFGQKTQLWWDIPLIESFKVFKEIYEISDSDYKERMAFLCDTLGLKEFLHQAVRTLSLGQRMRADLAAAWLHDPRILFLDEPTIGLDVLVKEKIRSAIKSMNERYHTTVILTTHDMQDIEDLCSRIIMIDEGRIIYDGPIGDIRLKFGNLRTITVSVGQLPENLDDFGGLVSYQHGEGTLKAKFDADKIELEKVVEYCFHSLHVTDIKVEAIGIEEVVRDLLVKEESSEKQT